MTKKCRECGEEKSELSFSWRKKALGQRQSYCKPCMKLRNAGHYQNNKDTYRATNKKHRDRNKTFVADYLRKHPCVDCGEKDPVVLDFDHLRDKTANISQLAHRTVAGLETLKKEMEKCEVVCANCHRRRTYKRGGWKYKL